MPRDPDVLRARLRLDTAKMLGVDLENMTASQEVRLARACMLRLELDDIESRKLNNQPFDVKAYVIASESLERLLGGQPDQPETGHDFSGARAELARLFDQRAIALERRDRRREAEMARDPDAARRELEMKIQAAIEKHSKPDVSVQMHLDNVIPDPASGDARYDGAVSLPVPVEQPAAAAGGSLPVLISPAPPPPPPPPVSAAERQANVDALNAQPANPASPPLPEWRRWVDENGIRTSPSSGGR
jgi:hypothetical protein